MLLAILTNRWVLMVVCAALVFGEMFLVKKWYTSFTKKITNVKFKRAVNVILGLTTCFVLAMAQMYALCDVLGAVFYWKFVIAATLGATLLYLILEKIFGESEVNALGRAFSEFISHSDMFDGNITTSGMVAVAEKLLDITQGIDEKVAKKEKKAIDEVVKRLDGFLEDGKVTKEEQAEVEKIIKETGVNLDGNSTYEKYKSLLNK